MRISTLGRLIPIFCALVVPVALQAADSSDQPSKLEKKVKEVQAACKSDIDQFCSKVNPGEGRMAACLNSVEDQLSSGCKKTWTDTKTGISKKIDKADVAFRKDCGEDVQKYCSDVPSGRGRILSCLNGHKDSLSSSCKQFEAKLDQKLSEIVG
jgi:hypothetical protein